MVRWYLISKLIRMKRSLCVRLKERKLKEMVLLNSLWFITISKAGALFLPIPSPVLKVVQRKASLLPVMSY